MFLREHRFSSPSSPRTHKVYSMRRRRKNARRSGLCPLAHVSTAYYETLLSHLIPDQKVNSSFEDG